MGGVQTFLNPYGTAVFGTEIEDCTPIIRSATHPDGLIDGFLNEDIKTSWELFLRGKSLNCGQNNCLGYRKRCPPDGRLAEDFTWLTYREVHELALCFGTALMRLSGAVDVLSFDDESYEPAKRMRLLGLFSKNRLEWLISEQAANAYGIAIVPLYDTLGRSALRLILHKTRMATIACSLECLSLLLDGLDESKEDDASLATSCHVKFVILFRDSHETISDNVQSRCQKAEIQLLYFDDLLHLDRQHSDSTREAELLSPCPGPPESINTVCYTSGTTGLPKGVLLTHRNVVQCSAGIIRGPITQGFNLLPTDTAISYLPLAHVLERLVCNVLYAMGGSIGIYSGEVTALLDDMRCLKPTIFVSVPRLFNRINDAVFHGVAGKSLVPRYLFYRGVSSKLDRLRTTAETTDRIWDSLVFSKTRQLMGNRLRYMICGGAPIDALVQEHMKILFCSSLMEGYGLSETFGPAFLANPKDPVSGHVGGVIPCCEFRLKSVPDMHYNVHDRPPRGELLIRGSSVSPGYFRDPQETAATLDAEGWLHTGDIAVLLPRGCVKIIDRRKNIFKLAQGEYVAPEKIENVYLQASLVSQIFVHGLSEKNYLVAIVVPDPAMVEIWAASTQKLCQNLELKMPSLMRTPELKAAILADMDKAARMGELKGFEKVKAIYIETDSFSIENGLLTPTLKIKRHEARKKYDAQIQKLYEAVTY